MSLDLVIKQLPFDELTNEIRRTMRRSAKDAVQLGYMLRRVLEDKLYLERYEDFDEYLECELSMDYTMASRFIGINKKYSVRGQSMEIAEEYEGYSQGLLIEMLSMTPEQEAKVTPEMTVKQAREVKKQDKVPKQLSVSGKADDVPEREEVIIEGSFREIKEPEKVATSQPEDNIFPCDDCGYSDAGSCGYSGTKDDYCVMGDKRVPKNQEPMKEEKLLPVDSNDGHALVKYILEQEKKSLDEMLLVNKVEILPEMMILRQKTIVGALAGMLCDLGSMEEPEASMQSELPILKNNDRRKEWLAAYKEWGLWYRDEHIDVNYYKYDFRDGSRLVVAEYPQRERWFGNEKKDEYRYHLLEKGRQKYDSKKTYDKQYNDETDSETYLVEFLKKLQKGAK